MAEPDSEPAPVDPIADTDSATTSEDSEAAEEVYSDVDNSRVMLTPRSAQQRDPTSRHSAPKMPNAALRKAPWNRMQSTGSSVDLFPEAHGAMANSPVVRHNAFGDGDGVDTQQTQQLAPLSGTQLRDIMGIDSDNASDEAGDESDAIDPDETKEAEALHDVSAKNSPLNGDAEIDGEEHISSSSDGDDADATAYPIVELGEVIEETPMKAFSLPSPVQEFTYVLCKWRHDKRWWPARVLKSDWQENARAARVIFKDDEEGITDLSTAVQFDLKPGDAVHYYGSERTQRYEILELSKASKPSAKLLFTSDGFTHATLKPLAKSGRIAETSVSELALTPADMDTWIKRRSFSHATLEPVNDSSPRPRTKPTRALNGDWNADSKRRRIQSRVSDSPSKLFVGCLFSISMSEENEKEKDEIAAILRTHGGRVLEKGLSDVISLSEISGDGSMLDHETDFGDAHFAAVLTDEPRRTFKFLEMVACGWPCLGPGYIRDCVNRGAVLDWLNYAHPAGVSTVGGRANMIVNADISAFHNRWLRRTPLSEQFQKRRVVVRTSVPVCASNPATAYSSYGESDHNGERSILLASLCVPPYGLWIYETKDAIPQGSLLLDLKSSKPAHGETPATDPRLLYDLQHYAAADSTIFKNLDWLVQCIINGEMV